LLCILAVALMAAAVIVRRTASSTVVNPGHATYAQLAAAVEADPGNPRAFYYLGVRLCDLGKLPPARAALDRAATLDPDSAEICLARLRVANLSGSRIETQYLLTAFLQRHPQNADMHFALAMFYHQQDAPKLAWQEAITVTQLAPKDAKA